MVKLRPLLGNELALASQLCLRSKGYWGYDEAFLDACKLELTLTESDLKNDPIIVAEDDRGMAGLAHVSTDESGCYLDKLFVDTDRIGQGVGQVLFEWSTKAARGLRASELIVEADPGAAPFYEKMGCIPAGQAASGSVGGRVLPRFVYRL
jgi:GNAT superfamily N-acetyltransferase